ncbi:MAG: DUF2484 family protein [Pseudomonadota bacterium]
MEPNLYSAIVLAAIWIGMGTFVALLPRAYHPPSALLLLTLLVPMLPMLWIVGHPVLALGFAAGMASMMRWPFYYMGRALLRYFGMHIKRDEIEQNL